MANVTKIDQSTLNNASATIAKNTESLVGEIDSMLTQLKQSKEAYQSNGAVTAQLDATIAELENIKSGYSSHNQEFMKALSDTVSSYAAADASIQSRVMASGDSGSGVVTPTGEKIDKPGYVPQGATLGADGRWANLDENGKGTIYNNKGIEGVPFETDDVGLKALASGMQGGQVVKMADGRVAVKDQYGGGRIFNEDGSTVDVSGRTIVAGKVGTIQASSDGADPYTQDFASEIFNSGLDNRKTNRLIKGFESQQEAEGADAAYGIDTEALREQLDVLKEEKGNIGVQNYGPGFSDEHNAQVLASQNASNPVVNDLNAVNDVGSVVESNQTDVANSATPLVSGTESTAPIEQNSTVSASMDVNNYGPGFSDEHNAAVLAAQAQQQPSGDAAVNNIPKPGEPIGFDSPSDEPDHPDYLPF